MRAAVFAYSRQGCRTARRAIKALAPAEIRAFAAERLDEEGFSKLKNPTESLYGSLFHWADAMVFIGSCGIAVRSIAPFVAGKTTDPAVIVIDELGRFVISLLSGHIGGANALARTLAGRLVAAPVITTATDIRGRFSVDTWATENGCCLSSLKAAKAVSAAILERDIPLACEFPVAGAYPGGIVPGNEGGIGIYIGLRREEPFGTTLRLVPKILHLGIGCRKNTPEEKISEAAEAVMAEHGLDWKAVRLVASIDLKKEEPGLLRFCRNRKLPAVFYPAQQLAKAAGNFTPSAFVEKMTGVDNVCERAAMVNAEKLLVRKTVCDGVTVAVAAEGWEVHFG